MADTSNLTTFLGDVADAIREKRGTELPIPAANFDTEIRNIQTGMDTSDATATADDILSPKTAYVNGEKVTGNIDVEYKTSSSNILFNDLDLDTTSVTGYCLTPDGNFGVLVDQDSIRTFKIVNNSISILNTYSWSDFGISRRDTISNSWFNNIKISNVPIQDDIYSVLLFPQYQYNIITRLKASTGELKYKIDDSYSEYYTWKNKYTGYSEPTYTIRFSNKDANVVALNYNSGRDAIVSVLNLGKSSATEVSAYGLNEASNVNGAYDLVWSTDDSKLFFTRKDSISRFTPTRMVVAYLDDEYNMINYYRPPSPTICSINSSMTRILDTKKNIKNVKLNDDYSMTVLDTVCSLENLVSSDVLFISDTLLLERIRATASNFTQIKIYDISNPSNITVNSIPIKDTTIDCLYNNYLYLKQDNSVLKLGYNTSVNIPIKAFMDNTFLYNVNDTTVNPNQVLTGKIFYNQAGKQIGTMPNNGTLNYTPNTTQQSIPAGYTSGGTVAGDSNLIPENIKKDISIFDVTGTLETGVDTSSDNPITASDVASGKEGFVNGEKITGTLPLFPNTRTFTVSNAGVTDNTEDSTLDLTTINTTKQILDSNVNMNFNADYSDVATAIGLTADKLVEGNTILGIEGMASSDSGQVSNFVETTLNYTQPINSIPQEISLSATIEANIGDYVKLKYNIPLEEDYGTESGQCGILIGKVISNVENTLRLNIIQKYTASNLAGGLSCGLDHIVTDTGYDGSFIEIHSTEQQDGPAYFEAPTYQIIISSQMSDVATAIGLTADKIKAGETILGITGTYTGEPEASL